ncbi:MAG: oxidative damage protection protein [Gemmatimonadetes bacterium]|nr:oxidative damage protection protein [Gemmatimonadota bacterium]
MTRMIRCAKLGREAEGLEHPPVPGELGTRIFEEISQDAWEEWTRHQTMIINEYRLNLATDAHQKILLREMEAFFFGAGANPPPDFVKPE